MADPSPLAQGHAWHGARGRAGRADSRQARLRKIYALAAVMLVLAGAVAALLFYLQEPPRPSLVVLRIDQYRDPRLPFSPWAAQDRDALQKLGLKENNAFTSQEKELLRQQLGVLGRDQPHEQPLALYLAAYAVVQDDGTVAVLPADANLDDAATWLPFKDVLDALRDCPANHLLLLLDLAQPCVEPRAGLLAANVPERLKPVLETAVKDNPKLQILAACGPGQTSHSSEELGHTVFAHYLVAGLAGRADGFTDNQPNTRVTVRELVVYVTMQVDRWVFHNTGLRQTPEFFGSTDIDYDLTGTAGKTLPQAAPLPGEYPSFLLDGWAERDRWWNERTVRTPPEQLVRLEQTLLAADERWRKGDNAAKVESDLQSALGRLQQKRIATVGPPERSEPRSLAEAVFRGQQVPDAAATDAQRKAKETETLRQLKELGDQWALVKQPKPNEKPSETAADRLTKKMEEFAKKFDGRPFDFAWTIFAAALKDSEPRSEHVRCWCDLLRTGGKPLPPYDEIRFLQRLASLSVSKPDDWPAAVSDALHLAELAAQVETFKPNQQPWLRAEYEQAVHKRQTAEALLFAPTGAARAEATAPMSAALSAFGDLYEHLAILRDAHRTRDEALVFLPGYADYLERDPTRLDGWLDAVQNTPLLRALLAKTPDAAQLASKLSEVKQKASTLQNSLKKMREPLDVPLARGPIAASSPARAADALEMRALLRLPTLTAAQRQTIWTNARTVAGKLNDEAVEREAVTDTLPPADDVRAVRQERDRAQLRARSALGLLQLAGSTEVDKVDAARRHVERAPLEEPAWEALRRELRRAWKKLETVPGPS